MTTTVLGVTLVISSIFITNFISIEPKNAIYYIIAIVWGLSLFSIMFCGLMSLGRCIEGLKIFEYKITDPSEFDKSFSPRNLMIILKKSIKNNYITIANTREKLKEKYDLAIKSLEIALGFLAFFVITSVLFLLFVFVGVL